MPMSMLGTQMVGPYFTGLVETAAKALFNGRSNRELWFRVEILEG